MSQTAPCFAAIADPRRLEISENDRFNPLLRDTVIGEWVAFGLDSVI
jgi:hypothetical protein